MNIIMNFSILKDCEPIYNLMKQQLDLNENLLVTYFNIMILSKEFNSNKILLMNNSINATTSANMNISNSNSNNNSNTEISPLTPTKKLQRNSISFINDKDIPFKQLSSAVDYDADSELSVVGKLF